MPEAPTPNGQENSPFRSGYERSDDSDDQNVLRFKDSPDHVVKEITPLWLDGNGPRSYLHEPEVDYLRRVAERGQAVQREFSELTSIKYPETQLYVPSNESDQPVMYRVTQLVHGVDLKDAIRDDAVPPEEVSVLIACLLDYYRTKLGTGEYFKADAQFLQQYVYGRVTGEERDSIQLVDTDPIYGVDSDGSGISIQNQLLDLYDTITTIAELRNYEFMTPIEQEARQFMQTHDIWHEDWDDNSE